METQVELGLKVNEVSLEAVFEDFKERIEAGTEIVSIDAELQVVES